MIIGQDKTDSTMEVLGAGHNHEVLSLRTRAARNLAARILAELNLGSDVTERLDLALAPSLLVETP
eukprot:4520975-Alexandrium_andersonii.AAC.1